MPSQSDAYHCYCTSIQEPKPAEYGRTLAAPQGEEKSYGVVANRTLFIPTVMKEIAAHLRGVVIPLDEASPAGVLFEAIPSMPIWQIAESQLH